MKVLIDTNVLLSAAYARDGHLSKPKTVINIAQRDENELLLPEYVLTEAYEKADMKFVNQGGIEQLKRYLANIRYTTIPTPETDAGIHVDITDKDDLPILRAAVAAGADAIVSGDKRFHAAETDTHGIPTYTPAKFAERFTSDSSGDRMPRHASAPEPRAE